MYRERPVTLPSSSEPVTQIWGAIPERTSWPHKKMTTISSVLCHDIPIMIDLADSRALIFDCDGTLVDTPPVYARAWAKGFLPFGREMPTAWYLDRAGMSEHVLIDAFESDFDVKVDREETVKIMRQAFLDEIDALGEITHIARIARENHGKRRMAVASGGSRAIVTASLKATGLDALFETVVTLDDVAHPKPAPDLFLEAARRLGTDPAYCIVFEDSQQGLEAARRAGMREIDVADIR